MIQKAGFEKIIDLDIEKIVSNGKIIDLNVEISAEKTIIALVFGIDDGNIYAKKVLTKEDITVLVQILVLGFKI